MSNELGFSNQLMTSFTAILIIHEKETVVKIRYQQDPSGIFYVLRTSPLTPYMTHIQNAQAPLCLGTFFVGLLPISLGHSLIGQALSHRPSNGTMQALPVSSVAAQPNLPGCVLELVEGPIASPFESFAVRQISIYTMAGERGPVAVTNLILGIQSGYTCLMGSDNRLTSLDHIRTHIALKFIGKQQ